MRLPERKFVDSVSKRAPGKSSPKANMLWIVAPRQPKIPWSTSPTAQTSLRAAATSLTSSRWATSVSWYSSRKTKRKRERSRSSTLGPRAQELDRERDLVAEVERVRSA